MKYMIMKIHDILIFLSMIISIFPSAQENPILFVSSGNETDAW